MPAIIPNISITTENVPTPGASNSPKITISATTCLSKQVYYTASLTSCIVLLLNGYFTPESTQRILALATPPFVILSNTIIHVIMPSEPSHFLFYFLLFLTSIVNALYTYIPNIFKMTSNPALNTITKTIAWPVGLIATFILSEMLFYAIIGMAIDSNTGFGWYGPFREGFYSASRGASRGIVEHWIGIGTHLQGILGAGSGTNPLLNEDENEASFPPPYPHDTDNRYQYSSKLDV